MRNVCELYIHEHYIIRKICEILSHENFQVHSTVLSRFLVPILIQSLHSITWHVMWYITLHV